MREKPTLPQDDPRPDRRAAQLARARDDLAYAWDRPAGVATAERVPSRFGFPLGVIAQLGEAKVKLAANRAALRLRDGREDERCTPETCRSLFVTMDAPPVSGVSDADRAFARQRVAGANPLEIRRIERVPEAFAALGAEPAAAEGRLYLGDWGVLDGLRAGSGKHLYAPLALFAREGVELAPVAIQCAQGGPVLTPRDGVAWELARAVVQIADANVHESFHHLGRAHFLLEAVAMATERQLSDAHPLHALLSPHLHGTLAINGAARDDLVVPGGSLEQLMAPILDDSIALVRRGLETFRLEDAPLPRDLARRGVDDPALDYPYRDDALLLWDAIRGFVDDYVRLYYADADVGADVELRGWLDELRSPDGGRIGGFPERVEGVEALVELIAGVVFAASAQHAALNYSQGDFMGDVANMPTAGYAPAPTPEDGLDPEEAWTRLLPTRSVAIAQLEFMVQQSGIRDDRLGRYPHGHFRDARVDEPLRRFQQRLHDADAVIAARDAARWLPYPYLRPSLVTASIHI